MNSSPTNSPSSKSQYWPEIDGIRALAIIAIVVNHLNKELLPSGYLGADIFFVISGFFVTSSLLASQELNLIKFLFGFISRRIKRIQPTLIVCVLLTGLTICLFNPSPEQEIKTAIAALFGFSNIYLAKQSTDYFATSTELNPFTQTWFLGALIQSELILCMIIWFSLLVSSNLCQHYWRQKRLFTWMLSIAVATSFLRFTYLYPIDRSTAYFSAFTRFWEIGLGALFYLLADHISERSRLRKHTPSYLHRLIASKKICLTLVLTSLYILFAPLKFAVPVILLTALMTATLLTLITQSESPGASYLNRREIVFLGSISYSIFLWHWSVLSISRWTIGIHWWLVPIQIGFVLIVSWFSFHYIEIPLRKSAWPKKVWQTIIYGIIISALISGFLLLLATVPGFSLYSGQNPTLIAAGVRSLTNPYSINGAEGRWEGLDCVITDDSDIGKRIDIQKCTLGSFANSSTRVLVAGNSFAASFTHAFDELVRDDKYSITITSSWGSSVLPKNLHNNNRNSTATYSEYYWSTVVFDVIKRLIPGDWVFLVNDMAEFSPPKRSIDHDIDMQEFKDQLISFSEALIGRSLNLAVLHGIPFAREANCKPNVAMKQWFHPFGTPCKMPGHTASLKRRKALDEVLQSLEQTGRITIVDLFDIFCPAKTCSYNAANGELLYRDEYSHPSVEATRLSAPIIREVLTSKT